MIMHFRHGLGWREHNNPLRGLTMARAVTLLEAGERGEYADLQWLYRFIEKRDAVLRALVRRRGAALAKLDWNIKVTPTEELPPGATPEMAEAQRDRLRAIYDGLDNLKEAVRFLATAEFRGFAHLEKHEDANGGWRRLEPVEQWHWTRRGLYGDWEYNRDATSVAHGEPIDPSQFIIREVPDPIDEIGLIAYLRKNLSQKDWDGFVETYGIPPLFIVGPPNVPADKEADYQALADKVAADARGYLPNGSDLKSPSGSDRGTNPFREHLAYQDEQLVLAGTGGLLSMLNQPTGIGGSQGEVHDAAFDDLAAGEAAEISELLQEAIDKVVLSRDFPGQPRLAYWELAAQEETDVGAICGQVAQLSSAGYQVDPGELTEKTGYQIALKPSGPAPVAGGFLGNRETIDPEEAVFAGFASDLQPVRARLEKILAIDDPEILANRLKAFQAELPGLLSDINADPASAGALAELMMAKAREGLKEVAP